MKVRSHNGINEALKILREQRGNIALLIGNGINRAPGGNGGVSWDQLMENLISSAAETCSDPEATKKGLLRLLEQGENGQTPASLPEVFDIIDATRKLGSTHPQSPRPYNLQSEIVSMLKGMEPGLAHKTLVRWAVRAKAPLMTTNYDHCFQETFAAGCKRRRFGSGPPKSDVYPWDRYYSPDLIKEPKSEFAIWHIHGDQALARSIRAGLDQYMGMVERLRKIKMRVAKEVLGAAPDGSSDAPAFHAAPWLRIFFGKKLWIQGIALRSAEVSIRWLLIQRFKFWRRLIEDCPAATGWYVHGPIDKVGRLEKERRIFFKSVGLQVIEITNSEDAYIHLYA